MLSPPARIAATCAALVLSACAGKDPGLRRELDLLRTELEGLRRQNEALTRRVDGLAERREEPRTPVAQPRPAAQPEAAPLVPPNLTVVRVSPPDEAEPEPAPVRERVLVTPARSGRPAPRLPTGVPVGEPDADRLDALGGSAGREISAEAGAELAAARRKGGVDRAHALEAFVERYPRHPSADNALVEAARDYDAAGSAAAGCQLARRVAEDYPAGDAVPSALEIVARCERSRP